MLRHLAVRLSKSRAAKGRSFVSSTKKTDMPICSRPDGAKIYYEKKGTGPIKVLLVSPGGMNSQISKWAAMPWNPWENLDIKKFTIVAMDQRNSDSNRSSGPIGNGWDTYAEDILAVLDECHFDNVLAMGSCIGPSYIFKCIELQPERFFGAVLMQPIGFATASVESEKWEGTNERHTKSWFNQWRETMLLNNRFSESEIDTLEQCMFGNNNFVFSVKPEWLSNLDTPLLVLMGHDYYHPALTSHQIAYLSPNAIINMRWWDTKALNHLGQQVENFFLNNYRGSSKF